MLLLASESIQKSRKWPWLASLAAHLLFLIVLFHQPKPVFVAPSSVVRGRSPSSSIIYLASTNSSDTRATDTPSSQALTLPAPSSSQRSQPQARKSPRRGPENPPRTRDLKQLADAGSPFGSLIEGPASGHDTRPALPVHFPDPDLDRSSLRGDVIVEITIDVRGNVIETRLLQGIEQGVNEKVITTVQRWRFTPATQDGMPIASKQDVHFHFPG
jgi:protein TonB